MMELPRFISLFVALAGLVSCATPHSQVSIVCHRQDDGVALIEDIQVVLERNSLECAPMEFPNKTIRCHPESVAVGFDGNVYIGVEGEEIRVSFLHEIVYSIFQTAAYSERFLISFRSVFDDLQLLGAERVEFQTFSDAGVYPRRIYIVDASVFSVDMLNDSNKADEASK